METFTQYEYETLSSVIARAIAYKDKTDEPAALRCRYPDGGKWKALVLRHQGLTFDQILGQLGGAKAEVEAEPSSEPEASSKPEVPKVVSGPWHELHPAMREIVLQSLVCAREEQMLEAAKVKAHTIAMGAAMGPIMQSNPAAAEAFSTGFDTTTAVPGHLRHAFDAAIQELQRS